LRATDKQVMTEAAVDCCCDVIKLHIMKSYEGVEL
jgi:hypothetical protein